MWSIRARRYNIYVSTLKKLKNTKIFLFVSEDSWANSRLDPGDMMQLHNLNYSSEISLNGEDDFDEEDDIDDDDDEEISVT